MHILVTIFTILASIALLFGTVLFSFVAGASGWPFSPSYIGAVVALAFVVRLKVGGENLIQDAEKGQEFFPAYVLPLSLPAGLYSFGWVIAFVLRLFN